MNHQGLEITSNMQQGIWKDRHQVTLGNFSSTELSPLILLNREWNCIFSAIIFIMFLLLFLITSKPTWGVMAISTEIS